MATLHDPIRRTRVHAPYPFAPFADQDIEQSILERFAEQVRAHGDRLAIQSDRDSLSYAALDRAATGVAHSILSERGRGPEHIALLFDRGPGIVASMLGVLKTANFYLVLDASYPHERLRHLVADSGATCIVTEARHLQLARELAGDATWILDVGDITDR